MKCILHQYKCIFSFLYNSNSLQKSITKQIDAHNQISIYFYNLVLNQNGFIKHIISALNHHDTDFATCTLFKDLLHTHNINDIIHLHSLQRPISFSLFPLKSYQRKKHRQQRWVFCWSWAYIRTHLFLYAISQNVNNFGRDQFSNIKTKVFSNEITDKVYWYCRNTINIQNKYLRKWYSKLTIREKIIMKDPLKFS